MMKIVTVISKANLICNFFLDNGFIVHLLSCTMVLLEIHTITFMYGFLIEFL